MKFVISVDEKNDRMLVEWNNKSPKTERKLKDLGGAWEDFNVYRFRLDPHTFKRVAKETAKLGSLTMAREDKEVMRKLIQAYKEAKELTKADADAEISDLLKIEAPEAAELMRAYQRAGVQLMSLNDATLLADDPGSGKTLQTIATMVSAGVEGDILVLAPSAAVQATWPGEIARWSPGDEVIGVTGTRKKREEKLKSIKRKSKSKRRWILCNIEMAKTKYIDAKMSNGKVSQSYYRHDYPELFYLDYENRPPKNPREWDAIVVDESHRALITTKSQAYKQTQTRCGLGKLKTKDGAKRIAISGTPFRGKMNNLWGTLNWLFPDKFTSYWNWVDRWFDTKSNGFGTEVARISKGMESDFYAAIAPFTLRRTKAEIAPELPPKLYAGTIPDGIDRDGVDERGLVGHWLEMSPKQRRAYEEMVEFATASLESGTLVANGVLAELTRLKQFASCYGRIETKYDVDGYEVPKFVPEMPSNKFNWLVEFLAELGIVPNEPQTGPEARKVVVASQFTSVINLYEQQLNKMGIATLKITGQVSGEDRNRAKELFQTDEGPQVFLLNTIAGGVSLTLDRADDIVILDETFIPDDQNQVEDRVHRVSRNHNVTVHYVRSLGTIEEKIARTTTDRDNLQKQLLDGERGVDFARRILNG